VEPHAKEPREVARPEGRTLSLRLCRRRAAALGAGCRIARCTAAAELAPWRPPPPPPRTRLLPSGFLGQAQNVLPPLLNPLRSPTRGCASSRPPSGAYTASTAATARCGSTAGTRPSRATTWRRSTTVRGRQHPATPGCRASGPRGAAGRSQRVPPPPLTLPLHPPLQSSPAPRAAPTTPATSRSPAGAAMAPRARARPPSGSPSTRRGRSGGAAAPPRAAWGGRWRVRRSARPPADPCGASVLG
jgi:hypothetical protein